MDLIIDEPVRGFIGDVSGFKLTGIENMRRFVRGDGPAPPAHHLTGLRPTEAGLGKATFTLPITGWLEDLTGTIHAGVYAYLADAPLASALYTGMPPGRGATTTELFMSYTRPSTRNTKSLVGRGQVIHLGRQVGISHVTIEDDQGRTMAYGSTRCMFPDFPFDPDAELVPPMEPIVDPPDPYLREPPTDLHVDLEELLPMRPLEAMRRIVAGEFSIGPVGALLGARPQKIEEGRYEIGWRRSPWFSAGTPAMYGGALALACDGAMGGAIYSTLEPGELYATLDMDVRYLRPVWLDDSWLTVTAEVRHRGSRIRVASVEVHDEQGRRVAMATASALVVPDGVARLIEGSPQDVIVQG